MKRNHSLVFVTVCFLCCNVFATLGSEINKYKTMYVPKDNEVVANVPRDSLATDYTQKPVCGKPDGLVVTHLEIKNEYYWQGKWELKDAFNHYHCLFRTVEVTYEVKCDNGLHYEGKDYLLSDKVRKLNETTASKLQVRNFKADAHDWKEHPLEALQPDGTILDENGNKYNYPVEKLDDKKKQEILNRWARQKVSFPPYYYTGGPGILPRPVLLVHGLNGNYGQWGVEPLNDNKYNTTGKVKANGYKNGSLPDMLARSNNLNTTEEAINSNGIYFFQAPKISVPHWDIINSVELASIFSAFDIKPYEYGIPYSLDELKKMNTDVPLTDSLSQSKLLYEKIKFVMKDFYKEKLKIDWEESDKYQIDLVGHSQGGLVIREMLRGLRDNPGDIEENGTANAANHINRVITINTPHFGSVLATPLDNLSEIEKDFYGVAKLIKDIEEPSGSPDRVLTEFKLDMNFWEKNGAFFNHVGINLPNNIAAILGCVFYSIPCLVVTNTDATLKLNGSSYIGTYKPVLDIYIAGAFKTTQKLDNIGALSGFGEILKKSHGALYLYKKSPFMTRLNNNYNGNFFPLRPDGNKITLLPMYSDSVHGILPKLFDEASEEADRLCAKGEKDPNCFALGVVLKNYVSKMSVDKIGIGFNFSEPYFDDDLWEVLQSIYSDWLTQSDAVVEASSQKFVDNIKNKPDDKYFLEPRPYTINTTISYDPIVIHGPFDNAPIDYKSTTQQGHDILCALSPACDSAFVLAQRSGRNAVIKLSEELERGKYKENLVEIAMGDYKKKIGGSS